MKSDKEASNQSDLNRRKRAVALKYDRSRADAPFVTAKGSGHLADSIVERARSSGVPIQEDKSLVEILSKIEINRQIPSELYGVVAEILSMVYQLDKSRRNSNSI